MEEPKKEPVFPNFDPTQNLSLAPANRSKRGFASRPLMESEIRDAQNRARSAAEAARLLGVVYNTYKKYAKMYGIFDDLKNPSCIGIPKKTNGGIGSYPLDDIIAGKHPKYDISKLKKRLLLNGYMEEKCSECGYSERRLTDHRVPLVLDFLDGDRTNFVYDNLRMLCLNCSFLINGNLTGPRQLYYY